MNTPVAVENLRFAEFLDGAWERSSYQPGKKFGTVASPSTFSP